MHASPVTTCPPGRPYVRPWPSLVPGSRRLLPLRRCFFSSYGGMSSKLRVIGSNKAGIVGHSSPLMEVLYVFNSMYLDSRRQTRMISNLLLRDGLELHEGGGGGAGYADVRGNMHRGMVSTRHSTPPPPP